MHKCVLIAALLVASVSAFPGGAPPEACDAGVPSHGVAAQSTVCPYDFVALGWTAGEFSSSKCKEVLIEKIKFTS